MSLNIPFRFRWLWREVWKANVGRWHCELANLMTCWTVKKFCCCIESDAIIRTWENSTVGWDKMFQVHVLVIGWIMIWITIGFVLITMKFHHETGSRWTTENLHRGDDNEINKQASFFRESQPLRIKRITAVKKSPSPLTSSVDDDATKKKKTFNETSTQLSWTILHISLILSFHCPPIVSQFLMWRYLTVTSLVLLHLESLSACVVSSQFLLLLLEFKNGRQSKLEKT